MRFQGKMYVTDQPACRLDTCKHKSNVCKHITSGDWITIVVSHVKKRNVK